MQSLHALDRADDVDVVDARVAADVVHSAVGLDLDALDDAAAEVAFVQRLAHVAAVARNRNYRRLRHEARHPAQVLLIEPAEHQGRAQNAVTQATVGYELLLR